MGGQTLFDTVRASKPIDMKISVRPGATNGTYFISIQAKDVANTTNKKLTYVFNKWPNNVTTVSRSEDDVTVYHICLEHPNNTLNYGIWANGRLMETCPKITLEKTMTIKID